MLCKHASTTKPFVKPQNSGSFTFSSSLCILRLPAGVQCEPSLGIDALPSYHSRKLINAFEILFKDLIIPTTSPTTSCSCSIVFSSPWGLDLSDVDSIGGVKPLPSKPRHLLPLHPLTMISCMDKFKFNSGYIFNHLNLTQCKV